MGRIGVQRTTCVGSGLFLCSNLLLEGISLTASGGNATDEDVGR